MEFYEGRWGYQAYIDIRVAVEDSTINSYI